MLEQKGNWWSGRRYGCVIRVLKETDSTNDDVRWAGERGAPQGYVVLAHAQKKGRGRMGRRWESPPGVNVYLSILDRMKVPMTQTPLLSLAVGLGVFDACVALCGEGAEEKLWIKWPNDLLALDAMGKYRKCAGVLIESLPALQSLVIGIGVNVNQITWPLALEEEAISLCQIFQRDFDRWQLVQLLLDKVGARVSQVEAEGSRIVDCLLNRLAWIGRPVTIDGFAGVFIGLDGGGALCIQDGWKVRKFWSGTLRLAG
ncbi:MAG: biotin--[acetyl-CoA-carboxylase] ligase [Sandaracinaceae bacterium]|nr:biotin--[acetyl-CoA-carboxylase] ligase [Sandaracinaceae bacterium]MDW8247060.1 biotin--[acetyl-CoA-carboxylase] ligase [Sandaracinaceae bacterium]